ncbi:MAG: choice-of-anchor J domain-containing protein, partial [Bacteroidales bacterium]|nr:choice-of-anchor J domain-containing protein [Bacteroidales bacterium]
MKKFLLFLMFALFCIPWAANAQEELTVYDGTNTNSYVPFYGLYADTQGAASECVFPSDELDAMTGGQITAIKFYITSSAAAAWTGTHQVYVGEVDATTLTGITGPSAFTVVKTASFDATGTELTITFDEPYTYGGGNLLIGTYVSVAGNWKSCSFAGVNQTENTGWYRTSATASGNAVKFLPKTTFTYTPGSGPVCDKPETLVAENIASDGATLTWTGGSGVYNIELNGTVIEENYAGYTYNLADLTPTMNYTVRLQSVCDEATSSWKTVSFTTPCATYDIPYTYDFEEEAPFACWTPITGVTRGNSSSNAHNSTYYLRFAGTTSNLVALPQFNEPTNNLRVEFWTRPESNTNSSCGTFSVGYMTDITDPSTFVEVANYAYNDWTSATYVKKAVDFINVPANANIAFRHNAGSSSWYWYADDVTVKEIPSCLAPTALAATATTNSAELSWTANSGETAWTVYYKKTSDENYSEVTNATNPYTLNGLDASSNYQYYVVANCSADDASEASDVFTFATECEAISSYPWTENFDSYTGVTVGTTNNLPVCWNYINTCTYSYYKGYPVIYNASGFSNSGNNHLRFYTYYSSYSSYDPQDQYAILPEMEGLNGKMLTLYARGGTNSSFKVGMMTDPTDVSTFVEIGTTTPATSYGEYTYMLEGEGNYVAIMVEAANSSVTTRTVYIDDITIAEPPTCIKPTGLTYRNVYGHGATLSWLLNDETQTAWDVQVSDTTDFSRIVALVENVDNHENYVLGGLDPETHYYVRVRGNCGGGDVSEWSNTVNFTTTVACPAPTGFAASEISGYTAKLNWTGNSENYTVSYRTAATAIGFFEAFNASGIPTGWTQYSGLVDGVLDGTAELTSGSNWTTTTYGLGAYNAKLNIYGTSRKNWLVTPEVTLENDYNLDFDLALTDYGNSVPIEDPTAQADDRFVVLVYADEAWTILREWNNSGSEYVYNTIATTGEHVSIDLSNYVGKTVKIAFYGESTAEGGDNDMHIDNVIVGIPVAAGEWQTVTVDEAPVTLTDLTPETTYEAKVQGNCGDDGLSLETNVITFTTLEACPTPTGLAVVDSLLTATTAGLSWNGFADVDSYTVQYRIAAHEEAPFMQNFESETSLNGWTFIGDDVNGIDGTGTNPAGLYSTAAHSGSNGFRFSSYTSSEDYNQYLISPELTVTGELKFWYKMYGTGDELNFGYSTTTDDVESFTWLELTNTTSWQEYTQVLSADVKYIAIHYYGDYKFYGYVDDITIGAQEIPAGEWQTASSATTNVTLTDLTPETPYEAQVKSDCSDPEEWSNMVTFTTLEQTDLPQTIALVTGTNWVSFNEEITLDDLKAALVAAAPGTAIKIYSQSNSTTYNPARNLWLGSLTWDVA